MKRLGQFLDHEFDLERVQSAAMGTLGRTNSSFRGQSTEGSPVGRWKGMLSPDEVAALEFLVGETLESVGYARTELGSQWSPGLKDKGLRSVYPLFLESKQWLKLNTPLGRFSSLAELELTPEVQ